MGKVDRHGELRLGCSPNGGRPLPPARGARLLERGDIDFQFRTETNLGFGEVTLRQRFLIQLLGDKCRPGMVKAFPASRAMQRRMKMIEKRHRRISSPLQFNLICKRMGLAAEVVDHRLQGRV
jgi:hypothetical protein